MNDKDNENDTIDTIDTITSEPQHNVADCSFDHKKEINAKKMETKFLKNQSQRTEELQKLKKSRSKSFDLERNPKGNLSRDQFWKLFRSECELLREEIDRYLYVDVNEKKKNKAYVTAEKRHEGQVVLDHVVVRLLHFENPNNIPHLVEGDIHIFSKEMADLKARIEKLRRIVCPQDKFTFKRYHDLKKKMMSGGNSDEESKFLLKRSNGSSKVKASASARSKSSPIIRRFYSDQRLQDESNIPETVEMINESWDLKQIQAVNNESLLSASKKQLDASAESGVTIIEDEKDKKIVLGDHDEIKGIKNVLSVKKMEHCTLISKQSYGTVHFRSLSSCTILLYPVSGSIVLHDCHNCNFCLSSRQLRIHSSTKLDVHAMVLSGPIIEDCSGMKFSGDYAYQMWEYSQNELGGINQHTYQLSLRNAMLDCAILDEATREKEIEFNQYHNVKDFNWLKIQKSPNFVIEQSLTETDIKHDHNDEEDEL